MIFINDEYNIAIIKDNKKVIKIKEENKEYLKWEIDTSILINIVILLDKSFIKTQKKTYDYFVGNKKALSHPYIKSILNIDFQKYINSFKN